MVVIRATMATVAMAEMAATEVAAPEAAVAAAAVETKVTTLTVAVESNNLVMIRRRRQLQQLQRREMTVAIGKILLGRLLRQQPSVVDTVELT